MRRDREGNDRKAILFELAFEPLGVARQLLSTRFEDDSLATLPKSLSIEQLRELAVSGGTSTRPTRTIKARQYYRSEAVRRYALRRAQGICECCDSPAPFFTKKHEPYLEVHHLNRVSDGGADTPEGVAAICPTCHRNIHAGISGSEVNSRLKKIISEKEESLSPA
ncbi:MULTISPECIES: HNH endonuclease [Microbulbifer]|uniref:HNH endonuclease n=1 Tax=Microbulbifer TaxID=48073 RepID=UPI001CD3EF5E|nr:HNH endonuclease [Microbulbifer agarilyticus]